ncbi:hypothetical protein SAMN05421837_107350 [Amycolatopsis pretoriensis]|uniref:HNH endonuclease n=1 Tax=Amycolatopsis pretoriensis TaxID=218821 RepID=A0A1H5R7T8_9PSEU|nr:hypothetical protein [Amycolatopsis pretoriensis]SEF34379.1 hypothetical protein SAMN05421837_107350 [Amycolatopsis pretoriensis]
MSRTEATRAGRVGRAWREVSSRVYAEETHCWICGDYVDPRLHPRHPRARSADHLIQLSHGGHPTRRAGLRLAHLGCNSARGNRLRAVALGDCACQHGRPCAPLASHQPRGYVAVDASSV